jgi:hypothetical protein
LPTERHHANGRVFFAVSGVFAVDDVPSYQDTSYASSNSPQYDIRIKGTSTPTGSFGGTPSTANPAQTLQMFRNYGPLTMQYEGRWALSIYKPVPFTAAERSIVREYIRQRYGIAP